MIDYRRPESRQNGLALPPPPTDNPDPWTTLETHPQVPPQTPPALSAPAYVPLLEQMLINQREILTWQQRTAVELRELKNKKRLDVKIQDLNMPFWSMVGLMIKVSLAALPAFACFGFLLFTIGGSLIASAIAAIAK